MKIKVKPFPFPAQIKDEGRGVTYSCIVLQMTDRGLMVEMALNPAIKTGETMHFSFVLPVSRDNIEGHAKVIKIYNQRRTYGAMKNPVPVSATDKDASATEPHSIALVELHFRDLSLAFIEKISRFLQMAGQKK